MEITSKEKTILKNGLKPLILLRNLGLKPFST